MAANPWWLTTKYNFDPEQGSSQAYYDATTGRQVYQDGSGRYAYQLPKEAQWGMQDDGNFGWSGGVDGQYVPDSLLNSQMQNAEVLGSGGQGLTRIRLADGTVTNATSLNGDAGDYDKLFSGTVPGAGYAQVQGQGAPQTQVVQGSDGNRYAALPPDARIYAPRPDDAGFGSLLMKDFAPLAMAALPFSGVGTTLASALGGGTLGSAGASAIINAGTSLLTGGDPIAGAIRGGAGSLINPALTNAGVSSAIAPYITNAAIAGTTGGNVGQSLLNTAINSGTKDLKALFSTPTQSNYEYTMSNGNDPSSVTVQNEPTSLQDMAGFQTAQSNDPSKIWQTNNTGDSKMTNDEFNVIDNMRGAGLVNDPNSTAMGGEFSQSGDGGDASSIWKTTGSNEIYNGTGSAGDNYLNYGVTGDPNDIDPNNSYWNLNPDGNGGENVDGGNTIPNFLKLLFGGGGASGGMSGLLKSIHPDLHKAIFGNMTQGQGDYKFPWSNVISGVLGYMGQNSTAKAITDATKYAVDKADPFASQRSIYQGKLAEAYNNPSSFLNNPLFTTARDDAINATQRKLAANGFNASGNEGLELTKAGTSATLNQAMPYMDLLSTNAGAKFSPAGAGQTALTGGMAAAQASNNALGNLGYAASSAANGQQPSILENMFNLPSNKNLQQAFSGWGF